MSYNPAQAIGAKSIQTIEMGVTSASSLSPDVTATNFTTFNARCKYYMETKAYIPVSSSTSAFIYYHSWGGFVPFGSVVRGNLVSGTSSGLDDVCIASNTPNVLITRSAVSVGSAVMSSGRKFYTYIWRIL